MSRELVGIIPCGGKGTRLGMPFPKELYPIRARPAIDYLMEQMLESGIREFLVILGREKQETMYYLGDGSRFGNDVNICYTYTEGKGGLGYAVFQTRRFVSSDSILVFGMPDVIITGAFSYHELVREHMKHSPMLTLGLFQVTNPHDFGVVATKGPRILSIEDKPKTPKSDWVWGVACFAPSFYDTIARTEANGSNEILLTSAFAEAVSQTRDVRFVKYHDSTYFDIGTRERAEQL